MNCRKAAISAIKKLDKWLDRTGWIGYDPYDIKGVPVFLWLERNKTNIAVKGIEMLATALITLFPLWSRRFFQIRPQLNAKAIALLARAYLKLYKIWMENKFLEKSYDALNWLIQNNHAPKTNQLGWGYPFDWQSVIFIPKRTPLIVVSALGGHALLDAYEATRESKWLGNAKKVKNFLINGLNVTMYDDESISFSYSPLDNFKVINSNLYSASFLSRFGKLANDSEAIEISRRIRKFAIRHQREDGAWEYWADRPSIVDAYHHGIILEWLKISTDYDEPIDGELNAIEKGLKFYKKTLCWRMEDVNSPQTQSFPLIFTL
ncbi:MAG: hypothetical protein DRI74_09265 [Bacteroidetes bacterium]|nr:MAG: hypothetical protein DRI74_09265 [Bacteroidota bacterium]